MKPAIVQRMTLLCGMLATAVAAGGDWPQILGPNRNGHAADDERLLEKWPAEGPRELWRKGVGSGFAGPAVVGEELYVFDRVGDKERLRQLNAGTGQEQWSVDFAASYRGGINPDNGPRCVPLVHGENVYLFGAAGDLHCVARRDGTRRWSRATHVEFGADEGYFGAGSTPIAMGGALLVNVGGTPDAGIVAFSLETGKTLWQVAGERASYSAPTSATLGGKQYALFVTRYNAMAVDPDSGDVRFRFPFGKRGPTVNAASPIMLGNQARLFLSAAYGIGCVLADLDEREPEVLWSNDATLSSQYNTPVYVDEYLYGIHGREDVGVAELRCVEAPSGRVRWAEQGFGVAHLIAADNRLLLLKIDGTLVLARPDPSQFSPLAQARVSTATTRALPALSGGRLYLRDNRGSDGTLVCLQVGRR